MKYYYREHLRAYSRLQAENLTSWGELHGAVGFENFSSRAFLTAVLPELHFAPPTPAVLNYGCGTGPDACFLAARGYRVDAIDLIPAAIEVARQQAAQRGLDIHFSVQDICELPHTGKRFDLIVDSFCLQCIVFDDDRQRLYSAIRARLAPRGYFLISTAILDADHFAEVTMGNTVAALDAMYTQYMEDDVIELTSGIVLTPLDEDPSAYSDAMHIRDRWYLPHRRHLTASQLESELWDAGFQVIYRDAAFAGSLACRMRE